jgi:hypothetical protein
MLYTGSYRPQTRQQSGKSVVVILVLLASLILLTLGATIAHFPINPSSHRVDFPPADWSVAPPDWTD